MKKYLYGIIGILIGFSLSLTITTHADNLSTIIGKLVQGEFPVKVEGVKLDKTAVVIDGTSYLPVRAIGDAIGYSISFNADLGIELKKNEVNKMTDTISTQSVTQPQTEQDAMNARAAQKNVDSDNLFQQKIQIEKLINDKKSKITATQGVIRTYSDPVMQHDEKIAHPDRDFDTWYKQFTDDLSQMNADLLVLQNQLGDIQSQIDTLNATPIQ